MNVDVDVQHLDLRTDVEGVCGRTQSVAPNAAFRSCYLDVMPPTDHLDLGESS